MTRPGRPPLDASDPSVSVTVRLPSKKFEAMCLRARAERITLATLLRRALERDAEKRISK